MPLRLIVTDTSPLIALLQLKAAGLIQSSDHVLGKAAAAGRNIERRRRPSSEASAVRRFGDYLKTTKRS